MARLHRNAYSRFAINPDLKHSRSRFARPFDHKTTFNAGQLIPIFYDEILPGDTVKMDMASLVRMSTPKFPVMDDAWIETFFFFVPNRLVWEHWKEFMGENNTDHWAPSVTYQIPQVTGGTVFSDFLTGSLADYFGLPILTHFGGANALSVSALPFRAYCLIWNEWFRDENLQDPIPFSMGDENISVPSSSGLSVAPVFQRVNFASGFYQPAPVQKFHDYFTSALPQPQKGDAVLLPIGDTAPIDFSGVSAVPVVTGADHSVASGLPLRFGGAIPPAGNWMTLKAGNDNSHINLLGDTATAGAVSRETPMVPVNLQFDAAGLNGAVADLSQATAATVNQVRMAFQTQKLLEQFARGGSRYTEVLSSMWGVDAGDARLQRPEYLGGTRERIGMQQVLQTSSSDSVSPQGNTAAFSLTTQRGHVFTKSFVEHGMLIGLACVRTRQSYQQGLERKWSRLDRLDFYFPVFAHLGEQPIFNKQILATATSSDNEVFGYQEAWAEYRYAPSYVTGYMRTDSDAPLDVWHYSDYYSTVPVLGDTWIRATPVPLDRTLAVTSEAAHQFIADFYFNPVWIREMPMYSIPGLVDHF